MSMVSLGKIMSKGQFIWSGNKCRDYWSRTHYSGRRLRGHVTGKISYWGDLEASWTTLTYRRTAIHGLSATEASLIRKEVRLGHFGKWHARNRSDGLIDLFHIKLIRKSVRTEIVEMNV